MHQNLHLLIVDRSQGLALAADFERRWLLPMLTCGERVRPAPLACTWAARHNLKAAVLGQWLGHVGSSAGIVDWLIVMDVCRAPAVAHPLAWVAIGSLLAHTGLLDYQDWAVRTCTPEGSLPCVPGAFGRLTWLDEVKAWVAVATGSAVDGVTCYRTGAHEVVVGVETRSRRLFFKGLTGDRGAEVSITRRLAGMMPDSFPSTAGFKEWPDDVVWWLADECPGRAAGATAAVSRALANAQQRVVSSGVPGELPQLPLPDIVHWATELMDEAAARERLLRAVERVTCARIPRSWIPMDLDAGNVLVDHAGAVRFIDVDESFAGPVPLPIALFARRTASVESQHAYEASWPALWGRVDWRAAELIAACVDLWLGWRRLQRNVARGEVYGACDVALPRIRERLAAAIYRR